MGVIADSKVQSHIQMPKCVLKRFENNSKRFYYYDVRKGIIGSNGYAKSINTVLGYYSQETEDYLRDYIETPFSELLCQIDKIDFDALPFSVPPETDALVKRFVYALISRSPQMIDELNKQSYFFKYLSTQSQHNIAASEGIALAEKRNILGDYFVTFAVNTTLMPFILPMCGLYNFKYNGIDTVFLPVSPQICIALVNKNGADFFIQNGAGIMLLVSDSFQATWFNKRAFSAQKKTNYGYVISPEKSAIELCLEE